jgi:hypothetical protein
MAMKSNYKIAAAVIASFVLGVGAVSVLHAQAKLPAYVVAEIDVKDQDGYAASVLIAKTCGRPSTVTWWPSRYSTGTTSCTHLTELSGAG